MPVLFIVDITHAVMQAEMTIYHAVRSREFPLGHSDPRAVITLKQTLIDAMLSVLPKLALAAVDQVCVNADLPTDSALIDHVAGQHDTYWHQFMGLATLDTLSRAYYQLIGMELVTDPRPIGAMPDLNFNPFDFLSAWPGQVLSGIFLEFVIAVRRSLAAHGLHNWCIGAQDDDPAIHNVLEVTHIGTSHGYLGASLIPMSNEPSTFLQS